MSEQPLVMCVMLTRDRPEMAKRAVECFRAQTYENKRLLIYCSGHDRYAIPWSCEDKQIDHTWDCSSIQCAIGTLRNSANSWAKGDILCHWDDDDYSSPHRIAEQVALLRASGADCVGYSDMLFWRDAKTARIATESDSQGEAWLYLGPQEALGTSLCYWRTTWERRPFPDQPRPGYANGEDTDWIKGLELRAIPSTGSLDSLHVDSVEVPNFDGIRKYAPGRMTVSGDPRMIASIHGRNTSGSYKLIADSTSWRRVPEWDSYCRERMAL